MIGPREPRVTDMKAVTEGLAVATDVLETEIPVGDLPDAWSRTSSLTAIPTLTPSYGMTVFHRASRASPLIS